MSRITGPVTVSDIKSRLLQPALTSTYSVDIIPPSPIKGGFSGNLEKFLKDNGIQTKSGSIDPVLLELSCSEASLPGSSLATIDINNDYMGVTQKHAYRRLYDDRADFTFYVTQDSNYYQIRFFDAWMKYITNEQFAKNLTNENNFISKVLYPKQYQGKIKITKFEKDYGSQYGPGSPLLTYTFLQAYPVSINSIPVSYDTSSLLKVTVSFAYTRYYIEPTKKVAPAVNPANPQSPGNPDVPGRIPEGAVYNDFLNGNRQRNGRAIGNPDLDQFGVQIPQGTRTDLGISGAVINA